MWRSERSHTVSQSPSIDHIMHKPAWCVFQITWLRGLVATIKNTLRDRALPCLAGHVAEVLVVGVAIDLRLERVERGAECLGLARLAVDLLVGPGFEVGSVVSGKGRVRVRGRVREPARSGVPSTRCRGRLPPY